MRALRSILGIRWQDKITILEILNRVEATSAEAILLKAQLRWTEHFNRTEKHGMPRQLLHGELVSGKRSQGRLCRRFKDCLKKT